MTPAARIQAAIEVLDRIGTGAPAEAALTNWARGARYAGSGDRAAVRSHVFDVLRCRASAAAYGGGADGRALMIGTLRQAGEPLGELFQGRGHGPPPLSLEERERLSQTPELTPSARLDMPEWLIPELERSLGPALALYCALSRQRAPVFLRANLARTSRERVIAELEACGIGAAAHPLSPSAVHLSGNPHGLRGLALNENGEVELQDAASQAVVDLLGIGPGARVLDFCAGGGGKALAMAARGARVFAHDAALARMADLPRRAARAQARIEVLAPGAAARHGPYDLVLVDAPCSGSGAWRRSPAGKWSLTQARLAEFQERQLAILGEAAQIVAPAGVLAYATCSVLRAENEDQIERFVKRHQGWRCTMQKRLGLDAGGDGFFTAHLTRTSGTP